MPGAPLIEKDVQEQLFNARKTRRRPGEVPYPFEYNHGMVDFDIWDHMYFVNATRRLSTHRFETPPAVVLDLGCGGGFWAIEAAKQWTSSTIIGFDIADVQPNLHDVEHYRHLSRRVKWLHGNLLDGLPFPGAQFDFVRIAYLGLGVPEDEWQFVLEEISRVMKPGAIFEVIEEDLLFPCTTIPPEPPQSPKLDLDLSLLSFNSPGSSTASTQDLAFSFSSDKRPPASPLRVKLHDFTRSRTVSRTNTLLAEPSWTSSIESTQNYIAVKKHPQDHSRIKASWDAMLARRFLTPKLLSVLPFYLSTFFDDVQSHPPFKVPLPPNSNFMIPPLRSRHSADSFRPSSSRGILDAPFDLKISTVSHSSKADGLSIRALYSVKDLAGPSQWSTMHLARTANTIAACRAAIYKEYERLYTENYDLNYREGDITLRQVFERDWNSWYNDMTDRMGMRDRLGMSLAWPETPGERPDCRKWRSEFEPEKHSTPDKGPPPQMHHDPEDLCRSMRIFVARKALASS